MMMSIRNWIRKHKKALFVTASAAGLGYLFYRTISSHYTTVKEREAHASLRQQAELRAESQLQLHFQSIQRISDTSRLPSILPQLKSELTDRLDLSGLTGKLMQGKDAPQILSGKEKLEVWEKLKILSFARAFTSMCSLALMVLLVRVQLNVLARHVYIDTARDISSAEHAVGLLCSSTLEFVVQGQSRSLSRVFQQNYLALCSINVMGKYAVQDQSRSLSRVFQQNYLSFADFLPNEGLEMLILDVKAAAEEVLASKTLREPCTLKDLRGIFENIMRSFKTNKRSWVPYVLPRNGVHIDDQTSKTTSQYESEGEAFDCGDEKLQSLLKETKAILDSEEFKEVLALSLDTSLDQVMEDFDGMYQERKVASMHLAKLIPLVASLGDSVLDLPDENRFVQLLIKLPQLQTFCATVYSAGQQ